MYPVIENLYIHIALKFTMLAIALNPFLSHLPYSSEDQDKQAIKLMKKKLYDAMIEDSLHKKIYTTKILPEGKHTILVFFGEWCPPCHKEMDTLTARMSELDKTYNTKALAVALHAGKVGDERINKIRKAHGWTQPLFFDQYDDALSTYRIQEIPHMMIIDKEGKLVYEKRGYYPGFFNEVKSVLQEINQQ
jgi:peroxiredoxin